MTRQTGRDAPCAAWLRRRLEAEGMAARELAAEVGVAARTVFAWRRGYRVPSAALRPRLEALLRAADDPMPPLSPGRSRAGRSDVPFARWFAGELNGRGLSPADFARAAGVGHTLVGRWCRGEAVPDADGVPLVAAVLGIDPAAVADAIGREAP